MSGHSKWSTIKRQKGVADQKKGQIFTKLSNAITIAVREGSGITDPGFNYRLRIAVDRAREANMPKESIDRAIEKAKGIGADQLSEAVYEGFAPGGAALVIQAVTDNKQRTVAEIKNILEKNGASLGTPGAVSYMFDQKGEIIVLKNNKTIDAMLEIATLAGAEDVDDEDDRAIIYTNPTKLIEVKKNIESQGLKVESAELTLKPKTLVPISQNSQGKVINLLEKIEDLDDVQKVYTNADFSVN